MTLTAQLEVEHKRDDSKFKLLTNKELIDYLLVSRRTIYRLVEHEGFPGHKIGGQYRTIDSELEKWLNNQRYGNQAVDEYKLRVRYDGKCTPIPLKSIPEVAEILRVNKRSVMRYMAKKNLSAFMVGDQVRLDSYLLNKWAKNQLTPTTFTLKVNSFPANWWFKFADVSCNFSL